jgi:GDP-L-fucose synthase
MNGISVMPTNLYGPGDNYNLQNSHVLPALLRKAHEAKVRGDTTLTVWGTGKVMREFLHSDDMADACVHLMLNYDGDEIVNVGTGTDVTIEQLAKLVCATVGFDGQLVFDSSKPDGTPRKLLDVSKLTGLGWKAKTPLAEGLAITYRDYLREHPEKPSA